MLDKIKRIFKNFSNYDGKAIIYWAVLIVYLVLAIIGLTQNIKPLFWGASGFVWGLSLGELLTYLE